jgi:hypothetical protein
MEAGTGIEPIYPALQAVAHPLRYPAICYIVLIEILSFDETQRFLLENYTILAWMRTVSV